MTLNEIYQLKSRFVVREVDGELILVPLTSHVARMNQMFVLNELGKFIWENIEENTTFEQLTTVILDNFEVEEAQAKSDLTVFIDKLTNTLSE